VLSSMLRFAVEGDHLTVVVSSADDPSAPAEVLPLVHAGNHVFELPNRSLGFVFTVDGDRVTQCEVRLRGMSFFQRY